MKFSSEHQPKPESIRGCTPHGFYPAGKCTDCKRVQQQNYRRKIGVKPRQIGCTPHGVYPAKDCQWCNIKWAEGKRRRRGIAARVYNCKHMNYAKTCNLCKAEGEAKRRNIRAKLSEQLRLEADRVAEAESVVARKDDDRPTAPWNLLKPSQQAQPFFNALLAEMDHSGERAKCEGKGEEYSYGDGHKPTRLHAQELCAGCPFLIQCREYGEKELPMKRMGMLWGGTRYDDEFGKEVK